MSHRHLAAFAAVVALVATASVPLAGQSEAQQAADAEAAWTMPRLPDGQPDLQGYWTTQTFTPLERPERLADQEFLSEEEAALLQQQLTAEGVDPLRRDAVAIADPDEREEALYQENRDASYVHYDNQIWLRTPVPKGLSTLRTSLITDPPNGRIPPLTPEGAARVAHEQAMSTVFDGYETRPLMERCVVWTHEGPPLLPPAYNDIHQIFQTPDHFVLFTELATNPPRIMALDGGPGLPDAIRSFGGDSRARWEGDTLVVETDQFIARRNYRGVEPAPARGGALHDASTRTRSATSSRSPIRPPGPARGGARCRWSASRGRCSSTAATRATTTSATSSRSTATSSGRRRKPRARAGSRARVARSLRPAGPAESARRTYVAGALRECLGGRRRPAAYAPVMKSR